MCKCKSLDGLKHGILLVAVHLDAVDGRHGNVGRLGCPQGFLVATEESLDLQQDSAEGSYLTNKYVSDLEKGDSWRTTGIQSFWAKL